jgi:hypothetical protein
MPISWNDTAEIDKYLGKKTTNGNTLLFEARLILEPDLADKIHWQKQTYTLIKAYGRMQLKQEIELVHEQLFTQIAHTSFSQKIKSLFKI